MIRVAITTDRFDEVAPHFGRLGLDPMALPCVRVELASSEILASARHEASQAEVLLITSVRTLDLLWPHRAMPAVKTAAVGESTAAEVAKRGGQVIAIGRSGLADLINQAVGWLPGARVVFPHAAGSDPSALQALRAHFADFREFEVYRSVPVPPPTTPVDAAAFAAPSAVKGWLLARDLDGQVVGVIGPTTEAAVARHRPPDVIAPQPSHEALARALASYLEVAV
ncbi:MAG: uroporphyrinogen-III synthase [Acidimicrobiia bacterium]